MSQFEVVVFVVTCCWGPLLNVQFRSVSSSFVSVPGDNQRCSSYGYNTRHGPFNTPAKYHCSRLGYAVVMNIWNIDAWQRQRTWPQQNQVISCHLSAWFIMLFSQIIATMISNVEFEVNNFHFTIEDIKGKFKWKCMELHRRVIQ